MTASAELALSTSYGEFLVARLARITATAHDSVQHEDALAYYAAGCLVRVEVRGLGEVDKDHGTSRS